MSEKFDAVVIGSGFGGSVMTYRLAEAGMEVCLLERGKAYPPNSFPRTPHAMGKNFWDPSKGLYGLFNIWSFKGSGAIVSSGLGGGSLIYANVLKRKDEKWFKEDLPDGGYEPWVVQYADLESHYEDVERMMNVQKYPFEHSAFQEIPKALALKEAAEKIKDADLKCDWMPVNLAVSFKSKPVTSPDENTTDNPPIIGEKINERFPNLHNLPRSTCRLCGECDIGCNYGSKNTLDFNYLSAAMHRNKKTKIRTLCEVRSFLEDTERGKGYRVKYVIHSPKNFSHPNYEPEEKTIICDYLIIAAGTFGSQYLLAKNKRNFPRLSNTLGNRYSVNGDLLSFLTKAKKSDGEPRNLDPSRGPVITSALRFGDDMDGSGKVGRGFYVEDGGHPNLINWASEVSGVFGYLKRTIKFLKLVFRYRIGLGFDSDLGSEIANLIGEANTAMTSMPILAMGRDVPQAKLFLRGGKYLDCDWTIKNSQKYFDRVRRAGKKIADAIDAKYLDNPSFRWNFHQVLTAHPIGGCAMGSSKETGVVDSCGQVFGYPGLYVADGSVFPGPVGPNPSLTIAALSNRFAEHIIARHKGEKHECDDAK